MEASKTSINTYENYTSRQADRERTISQRIQNISDPLQAIQSIIENEGFNLKTIWDSDSGYPFDSAMFLIIMIPVVLGIIGNYVASQWEPQPTGEELYDDYGNRIVEYPKMPIAYLQQSRQDLSATRENRNSLAWLCHKWLISTNDVVQELQAPYPLERSTLRTVPEETGKGKVFAKGYERLQQAAQQWKLQLKKLKKEDLRRRLENRKISRPLHTVPHSLVFRKAPAADVRYLERRLPRVRKLWKKLNQWVEEYNAREIKEVHSSDAKDSYWSSSETFSSDSGEHWKSYKGDAKRWARVMKATAQWKLEKGRKAQAKATAAETARKKREAAAKAAADAAEAEEVELQRRKSSRQSSSFLLTASPRKSRHSMNTEKASLSQGHKSKSSVKGESESSTHGKKSKKLEKH